MSGELLLPRPDRSLVSYRVGPPAAFETPSLPLRERVAYAAAHVVAEPLAASDPTSDAVVDWDATMMYRHYLWSLGLGVAEAMDTAQRGMGLRWETARELIRRSLAEARAVNGLIACGAGTDHLAPNVHHDLAAIVDAYEEQCAFVEGEGGRVILMASRALAATARSPDDYARVYGRILDGLRQPAILHWLGDMFDPALAGYWGMPDVDSAMDVCVDIIHANSAKIDGIKISLLNDQREISMRRRLPAHVRMYTGDDFNYVDLMRGDEQGFSHALLGIFDAIAPAAAAALGALDQGDDDRFVRLLAPTVPLSRHIFQAPTRFYKTGIVFLAYLNGHQNHFRMVGGQESARSILHLADLFVLADQAGLLRDPELATARMRLVLALAGIKGNGAHAPS